MFPIVRLMIAATLASVVALICGFGMFAVFHVGHEPLVRLPAATAPLQLVADNAAMRSTAGLTSSDVFDVRFAVKAPSHPAEPGIPSPPNEPRATEALEAEPEPAAKGDAPGPERTSSTTGEATETTPAPSSAEPSADDQADSAAPPQPESTFSAMSAAAASPPADTITPGPEPSIKAPVITVAAEDLAPAPAIETTANEPANPPTASREHTDPIWRERVRLATAAAATTGSGGPRPHKAALKKPKRTHTVLRPSSAPRLIVVRYVRTRYRQTQYAAVTDQGFGTTQEQNFQTAQAQYRSAPQVRVRYLRIVVRKAAPPAAGVGGPFVRVPRP
jgi:hypothetical protein